MFDEIMIDKNIILSFCVGVSLSACCGFRVFIPLLITSLALRFNYIPQTDSLAWLGSNESLIIFIVASIFEIFSYYIPFVDNALDSMMGPLSFVAGALITTSFLGDSFPPAIKYTLGIIAGGGSAGVVQGATSIARLGVTKLTGGMGNIWFAKIEHLISFVMSIVSILMPLLTLFLFLCFLLFVLYLWRLLKKRKLKKEVTHEHH